MTATTPAALDALTDTTRLKLTDHMISDTLTENATLRAQVETLTTEQSRLADINEGLTRDFNALNLDGTRLDDKIRAIAAERDEERAIVSRIWTMLGGHSYEELAGRSIYDLIAELQARALASDTARASAESALAEARSTLADLADFVEGKFEGETDEPCEREDWLCPNCEEFGCIRLKVERARAAMETLT